MEPEELNWLAFEAKRHKCIVEIGSFLGRSTRVLADNTDGIVYAVDNWKGPQEFSPPVVPPENIWPEFSKNLADHIATGKVVPVKADSREAIKRFICKHFDMVFIDAGHDFESVSFDIQAWSKQLELGGLLCGHDAQWQGVAEARRLLLPPHMTGVGKLWAVDNFQGLAI